MIDSADAQHAYIVESKQVIFGFADLSSRICPPTILTRHRDSRAIS